MRFSTAFAFITCAFSGMKSVDADAWINEFHYDNSGGDQGEFVEVAVTAGTDLSGWTLHFYNGANAQSYATSPLSGVAPPSGVSFVSVNKAGIQNGSPDGIALVDNSNAVVQFLSYEGTLTASDGPASGMTSTNVGVQEGSSSPISDSLQLAGSGCSYGDFSWQDPASNTNGSVNNGQTFTCQSSSVALWINEFHYDNSGSDSQEFVEIACSTGADMSNIALYLYNGNGGAVYSSFLSITPATCPGGVNGIGFISVTTTGIQNGGPDGIALYDGSSVVEFISYEGSFTATNGVASGTQSVDVVVSENSGTSVGFSLQKGGTGCSAGDFPWQSPQSNTIASVNAGQTISCTGLPTAPTPPVPTPTPPPPTPPPPTPPPPTPPPPTPPTGVAPPTGSPLDSNMPTVASGHGTMSTSADNYWILPSGIADIFIDVESISDLDFELSDGSTIIVGPGGPLSSSTPSYTTYGGLRIDYSGSSGEQRSGTEGWEYVHIFGTLSSDLTLQLSGAGSGDIRYWWGYYASVRTGGVSKSALNQIISTGPTLTALSYTPGCWEALKRTDQDWLDTNSVKGIYSRKSIPKADQDSGGSCNDFWNREHVCPKSICGLTTGSAGAGTDIHSLRAEDKSVNTQRSNKDFFEGGTAVLDCNQCFETSQTFEPPDVTKGDAARMIFYMSTRYINNIEIIDGDGSSTGSNSIGDQATLELWNDVDPVDAEEIHRNNMIFKIQGNRNPFIDNAAWVDLITSSDASSEPSTGPSSSSSPSSRPTLSSGTPSTSSLGSPNVSAAPSSSPSWSPSTQPSSLPSSEPKNLISGMPSSGPSSEPSTGPSSSSSPSSRPTLSSGTPSASSSGSPSLSAAPSSGPSWIMVTFVSTFLVAFEQA